MPLKMVDVTGDEVDEGTCHASKLVFLSRLNSVCEKDGRHLTRPRSSLVNFEAHCDTKGCGFTIHAGVQGKGSGEWRVSKFAGHSMVCVGTHGRNGHEMNAAQLAPVVVDNVRADGKYSWKSVQVDLGPYLAKKPTDKFCKRVLEFAKTLVGGEPDDNIKLLPAYIEQLNEVHEARLTTMDAQMMKDILLGIAESDFNLAKKNALKVAKQSKLPVVNPNWEDFKPDYSRVVEGGVYFESWAFAPRTSINQMKRGLLSHVQTMDAGHDEARE